MLIAVYDLKAFTKEDNWKPQQPTNYWSRLALALFFFRCLHILTEINYEFFGVN